MNIHIPSEPAKDRLFLESALAAEAVHSTADVKAWLRSRELANQFEVRKIPFVKMQGWHFEGDTGDIVHKSGRFFSIRGIEVATNFGRTPRWTQPIIHQPEIGILGFLTKRMRGILHFLVQVKMEPGNINIVQLSPTLQATLSNYAQVHGGSRPKYLEYFRHRNRAEVLIDQLQSEQGTRFMRKRNRNMIVRVPDDEAVEENPDFYWLTLGQLLYFLSFDNVVNMDARSVLGCIRYAAHGAEASGRGAPLPDGTFAKEIMDSALSDERAAEHDFDFLLSWLTELRARFSFQVRPLPLNQLEGWRLEESELRHESRRFFTVIAVSVSATNREVNSWCQPLIESKKGGIISFICQKRKGLLHFLVQGRVEPGYLDVVELAPTVSCTPGNYDNGRGHLPPFTELILNASPAQVRYRSVQSDEGGRFYHDERAHSVVGIDPTAESPLPENYVWMTLRQIKEFVRFSSYLSMEARSLVSCLPPLESMVKLAPAASASWL